ncbi:unnamed protein product [Allacma fusca]|uniref:Uncharacterized protein n=1 Tax=Allacma fusca TaxID=39272 RepID=A0A8J2K4B0_9HEXA|nr:unnamed protein product [Allacma fusca]
MSESEYAIETLEPLRESLEFGISTASSAESGGSLEMKTLQEVVEQMRSDNVGPNASEEPIQKIFSTLRSRCPDVPSCGVILTNCSTLNLSNLFFWTKR